MTKTLLTIEVAVILTFGVLLVHSSFITRSKVERYLGIGTICAVTLFIYGVF